MKSSILLALVAIAVGAAVPANATTANFNFLTCGGSNPSCSSTLSSYVIGSTGTTGITATATAFYVTSTSSGSMQSGQVGAYSGNGLGICENGSDTGSGANCDSPWHQIDNGKNPVNNGPSTQQDYEFMLIAFTGSAVNLSNVAVQLGNYGGGSSDPFDVTYFTSSAATLTTAVTSLSYSQIAAGADGFSAAQSSSCSSGVTLDQTAQGEVTSDCNAEAMDTLSGSNVTYLLIGASVSDASGSDYFKLQALDVNKSSATPEPATFGLIGLSLAGLGFLKRKRKLT